MPSAVRQLEYVAQAERAFGLGGSIEIAAAVESEDAGRAGLTVRSREIVQHLERASPVRGTQLVDRSAAICAADTRRAVQVPAASAISPP